MKTKYFFLAAATLLTLSSCQDDKILSEESYHESNGIKVEVNDERELPETRTTYDELTTSFQEGDAIGVYAVYGSTTVSSNIRFIRENDGTWTPSAYVPYNPDYTYYAYYPYTNTPYTFATSGDADTRFADFISDANDIFHKNNQSSLINFKASDYMHAKGIVTGTRTVKFTMKHRKALVVINEESVKNQWWYVEKPDEKFSATLTYSGNIPYAAGDYKFFLMKADTPTSIGGVTMTASKGKYILSQARMTGTPTYMYATSTDRGVNYGGFSTNKPNWLTIDANAEGALPTNFAITTASSTSRTINLGYGTQRDVPGDETLRNAVPVKNRDLSLYNNDGLPRGTRTTANCYLVHAPGSYRIPLVYGNAIKEDETNTLAYASNTATNTYSLQTLINHQGTEITAPWIKDNGINVNGAKLVWEDVKGAITDVNIDGDYLAFTVNPEKIAEGNAVVAATSDGTIVWSWHIWMTNETLTNLTTVSTGSHTYNVAHVNVGQVEGTVSSGTMYAGDWCKIQATSNGLTIEWEVEAKNYLYNSTTYYLPCTYYQWGRKDPMYTPYWAYYADGTQTNYNNNNIITTSCTIDETIKNPQKLYNDYQINYNYWDINKKNATNQTTATQKTIYDPCPPEFCVPTSELFVFTTSYGGGMSALPFNTKTGGYWTTNISGDPIFFSLTGTRNRMTGSHSSQASGQYLSATLGTINTARTLSLYSSIFTSSDPSVYEGYAVRAVLEE